MDSVGSRTVNVPPRWGWAFPAVDDGDFGVAELHDVRSKLKALRAMTTPP
jgi:hypothetical protein